jgi:dynein light chain Tctex-type 1
MQKADCGLNLSGSCYWDNEVDGTVTVKWDSPTLICVVNVFGCAL